MERGRYLIAARSNTQGTLDWHKRAPGGSNCSWRGVLVCVKE